MAVEENTAPRFIRLPEVMRRVGLSRPQVYKLISKDRFPSPIKIGSASAWVEGEIASWISERIAESRRSAAA
jgi:prophage regulatory protein